MLRKFGMVLVVLAVLAGAGDLCGLTLPTLRWPFETSRDFGFLHWEFEGEIALPGSGSLGWHFVFPWFGWLCVLVMLGAGLWMILGTGEMRLTPITERRIQRFRSIGRGYWSFVILLFFVGLAALDQVLVGKEALFVSDGKNWHFPAFTREDPKGEDFGLEGDLAKAAPDYRELKKKFREEGRGTVVLPLVPFDPTNDTEVATSQQMEERGGLLYRKGREKPYDGLACLVYDLDVPEKIFMQYRYRKGKKEGLAEGRDREGVRVYAANFKEGEMIPGSESWNGQGSAADFLAQEAGASGPVVVRYMPSPPSWRDRHYLGTNSQGYDVLAYLFGGLQVNIKAALFYIPFIYVIGVTVGLLMGFFGGAYDILVQRLIEILANIPFLFIVIIISETVPKSYKGLGIILLILAAFGWMGMTNLMRTAAFKEKSRDYIAATRVIGASTWRVIFKHLLPNTVAILVTLVPFSISGLVFALTSLDYLGFGLPPEYASWGKLLKDGLDNLSSPWLVSSAFVALLALLILVTFIGEAVREAFDPKKFTYYR